MLAHVSAEMTRWRVVARLLPGDPRHLARFQVVGRLGRGGMGVVYLAEHPEMGPAALKLVEAARLEDGSFRARFRREVEAAERVRSPRVAPVLAADPDADTPWLATTFVDGPTLDEAVDEAGPLEGDRLVALAVALGDALAAIHRAGVVHRDLKPANILLTAETPVVIDFGIAALHEAPALTRTGSVLGTPGWMAPEQLRGRRRPGPRVDVFAWGLVVAYAASGRPAFGTGPVDALGYRIVHQAPDLPALPRPLDRLVRAALTKDPQLRPDVAGLLETLTTETLARGPHAAAAGTTVAGPTLADRTEVVPTIVARGWDVDALPARPPGRRPAPAPGAGAGTAEPQAGEPAGSAEPQAGEPAAPGVPGAGAGTAQVAADAARPLADPDATLVEPPTVVAPTAPVAPAGPPFWFGGAERHDARSLAEAFQDQWDEAIDQVFRRRNPIWLGELQAFLGARGLAEADRLVDEGPGGAPPAAAMARLLVALDPGAEPRIGPLWLTDEGLAAAAQAVLDGRDGGERLEEIRDAHVLRLWRSLPGMDRAAWIDERWHSSLEAFGRLAATVSPQVGWPTPGERNRAAALLLLCAVHPDHERRLGRRLAAARRTVAQRQAWWAQLAAEGRHGSAAAALAVMTASRARALAQRERDAAREVARAEREAERRRRDDDRLERQRRQAADAAARPRWRYRPLPRAQSGVRRTWVLVVVLAALVVHLWAVQRFGDQVVAHYGGASRTVRSDEARRAFERLEGTTVLAGLLVVALPLAHLATRVLVRRGASRGGVRLYAGVAAALDLLLGLALMAAAAVAALVLGAGAEGQLRPDVAQPFGDDEPWVAVGLLLPLGLAGLVLAIRSPWRLARAAFGGPVAGPPALAPPPAVPPVPPGVR